MRPQSSIKWAFLACFRAAEPRIGHPRVTAERVFARAIPDISPCSKGPARAAVRTHAREAGGDHPDLSRDPPDEGHPRHPAGKFIDLARFLVHRSLPAPEIFWGLPDAGKFWPAFKSPARCVAASDGIRQGLSDR